MDENNLENVIDVEDMRDENINISDVIEVIATDPDFNQSTMFNGGGEISQQAAPQVMQPCTQAYVRIIEQPASKALRFRYQCEGRSAGSIPGASSSPENKTFPAIQVVGYKGKAVVVVSCVTKDAPYRPHPHNLVGREGCKKGVCTLEVSPETMTVTFSNLGIQCVKKKDIEEALKTREQIRVDPFRTGFGHRNQPTSIDLNAVRLCFQVFLEGEQRGKYTVALTPVVSEPIYDKKAMCDLVIVKLSDCVSYVDGGRKDIILLCEKVTKEDIQIRFYEEKDGQVVWEGFGDFQPSQVHKQTAIWFRAPRYKTLDVTEPVKVFIQLRRPSDGAISEPLPFELLPLDSGRPAYWSFRRSVAKKANYDLFSTLLANDSRLIAKRQLSSMNTTTNGINKTVPESISKTTPVILEEEPIIVENNNNNTEVITESTCDYSTVEKSNKNNKTNNISEEKSFNELINEVAELDQIYSETQARLLSLNNDDMSSTVNTAKPQIESCDSFDDTRTYTSLQLAFKNPVEISDTTIEKYEDVIVNPQSPIINLGPSAKRENDVEKLPPLPPKRAKKIETAITGSSTSIQLTGKQAESLLQGSGQLSRSVSVSRSHSFNLPRPKSQNELSAPVKQLPPTPSATLPNTKKRGFFSKLFGGKRKNSSTPASKRGSFSSSKSLQVGGNSSIGHSISNLSTRSYGDAVSIHIPLKDPTDKNDQTAEDRNVQTKTNGLVEIKDADMNETNDCGMNLDLTEAEHYALYTTMAPFATQSEFDETSCYYAPVEGGTILSQTTTTAET